MCFYTINSLVSKRIAHVTGLLVLSGIMLVLAVLLLTRLFDPPISKLGDTREQRNTRIKSAWKDGNIIVLVRHAIRCDRSDSPCLEASDGITVSGKEQSVSTGKSFEKLGIQRADIIVSPSTRTRQTAFSMFKGAAKENELLLQCKTIIYDDLARIKTIGRNLVLITHSHCIERLEQLLNIEEYKKASYGSLLFISLDEKSKVPVAAELIDAEEFAKEFWAEKQTP